LLASSSHINASRLCVRGRGIATRIAIEVQS
jgi:hypothetical protein